MFTHSRELTNAMDVLHSASYFLTVHLYWGWSQILVHLSARERSAFLSPDCLFEIRVLPFGAYIVPATIEIHGHLREKAQGKFLCYLDDDIIVA